MRKAIWSLCVVAAFTVLVADAGLAGAANFKAGTYPATVTGVQGGEKAPLPPEGTRGGGVPDEFFIGFEGALMISCKEGGFKGQLVTSASSLSTAPAFSGCTFFNLPATINMNGCEWVLNAGTGSGDEFSGTIDIACPVGKKFLINATLLGSTCEIEIGSQTGAGSVVYTNLTEESPTAMVAGFGSHKMTYTKTKDNGVCPLSGTGTKTDGGFDGGATLTSESGIRIE